MPHLHERKYRGRVNPPPMGEYTNPELAKRFKIKFKPPLDEDHENLRILPSDLKIELEKWKR